MSGAGKKLDTKSLSEKDKQYFFHPFTALKTHEQSGGKIIVKARLEQERLCLTVSDTGLGFGHGPSTSGGGFGLDNIRQRLRALYASHARLIVTANVPHGFVAVIDLPLHANMKKTQIVAHEKS